MSLEYIIDTLMSANAFKLLPKEELKTSFVLKASIPQFNNLPEAIKKYKYIVIKAIDSTYKAKQEIDALQQTQGMIEVVDFIGAVPNFSFEKYNFAGKETLGTLTPKTIILMEGLEGSIDSGYFLFAAQQNPVLQQKVIKTVRGMVQEFIPHGCTHGDLRPRNVFYGFVDENSGDLYHPDNITIKVGDLGSFSSTKFIETDESSAFETDFVNKVNRFNNRRYRKSLLSTQPNLRSSEGAIISSIEAGFPANP